MASASLRFKVTTPGWLCEHFSVCIYFNRTCFTFTLLHSVQMIVVNTLDNATTKGFCFDLLDNRIKVNFFFQPLSKKKQKDPQERHTRCILIRGVHVNFYFCFSAFLLLAQIQIRNVFLSYSLGYISSFVQYTKTSNTELPGLYAQHNTVIFIMAFFPRCNTPSTSRPHCSSTRGLLSALSTQIQSRGGTSKQKLTGQLWLSLNSCC